MSTQFVLGYEQYIGSSYKFQVEGYYKDISNLLTFEDPDKKLNQFAKPIPMKVAKNTDIGIANADAGGSTQKGAGCSSHCAAARWCPCPQRTSKSLRWWCRRSRGDPPAS